MNQTKINQAIPRLEKAFQMMDNVQIIDSKRALVKSQNSSQIYEVSMEHSTCTCPDYVYRGLKCKHQRVVSLYQQKIAEMQTTKET